jgi:hypothetical protein
MESSCSEASALRRLRGRDQGDVSRVGVATGAAPWYADHVRWITGTAAQFKGLHTDLITMTGNVAQVFVADQEWRTTLRACRDALRPDGQLVFV